VLLFLQLLPGFLLPARDAFEKFTYERLQERRKFGSQRKDLFSILLGEEAESDTKLTPIQLHSECGLAVVAGSDTTASAMACAWYFLLRNPQTYSRLRGEIDALFPNSEVPTDATKLATQAPYLNAVINESLRLYPPTLSGSERTAPPEGIVVLDNYVRAGTQISVARYSVHRDTRCYTHPDKFLPERWLDDNKSKDVLNHNAFHPFGTGPVRLWPFPSSERCSNVVAGCLC
jgi:cytochrome P450